MIYILLVTTDLLICYYEGSIVGLAIICRICKNPSVFASYFLMY